VGEEKAIQTAWRLEKEAKSIPTNCHELKTRLE